MHELRFIYILKLLKFPKLQSRLSREPNAPDKQMLHQAFLSFFDVELPPALRLIATTNILAHPV